MSFGGRMTIRQVEAPRPGADKRTLVLAGSMGPVGQLAFGGSQRAEVTWVSGSSVASVRLDGPQEDTTDASFRWRGHMFSRGEATLDGVPLDAIDDVVEAMDGMRRDTALLEVEWAGVVYTGFLQHFEATYRGSMSVDATARFQWVAPTNYDGREVFGGLPMSPAGFAAQLEAAWDDAMSRATSAVTHVRERVEDIALATARVRENISRISAVAESLTNAAHDVQAVRKGMADGMAQAVLATFDVVRALAISAATLAQSDDGIQQMRAATYLAHVGKAARDLVYLLARERRHYRPSETDVLGWHRCSQGETVWSVAALWYGSSAAGVAIARRNHLHSSVLRAGQVLAIPRLEAWHARV